MNNSVRMMAVVHYIFIDYIFIVYTQELDNTVKKRFNFASGHAFCSASYHRKKSVTSSNYYN